MQLSQWTLNAPESLSPVPSAQGFVVLGHLALNQLKTSFRDLGTKAFTKALRGWGWVALALVLTLSVLLAPQAIAANVDPYVTRYLKVSEPVPLSVDATGETQLFSAQALSVGKHLFDENCKNCHVGGATLPDPTVPLSLEALKAATPPRDTLSSLVSYIRQPMTYDGSKESLGCRQISESWMPQADVENLAAFILRAAQTAPGWGTSKF